MGGELCKCGEERRVARRCKLMSSYLSDHRVTLQLLVWPPLTRSVHIW